MTNWKIGSDDDDEDIDCDMKKMDRVRRGSDNDLYLI